jgi:hypothetical protein
MNNANGDRLLTTINDGDRVTLRAPNGDTITGRARTNTAGAPLAILPGRFYILTRDNIITIRPR